MYTYAKPVLLVYEYTCKISAISEKMKRGVYPVMRVHPMGAQLVSTTDNMDVENIDESSWAKWALRVNIGAGIVHFVLFIVTLTVSSSSPSLLTHSTEQVWRNVTMNITMPESCSNHTISEHWGDLQIYPVLVSYSSIDLTVVTALWFFLSFFFPLMEFVFIYCVKKCSFDQYLRKYPTFHFRFAEYTVSASLMIVVLYALVGFRDIHILIFVGILNGMTMIFGDFADMLRRVECKYLSMAGGTTDFYVKYNLKYFKFIVHGFGWVHLLVYWGVLLGRIASLNSGQCSELGGGEVPGFVGLIFGVICIAFVSFGLVQFISFIAFQNATSAAALYHISSKVMLAYTVLSLAAKSSMGGILLVNILIRSS